MGKPKLALAILERMSRADKGGAGSSSSESTSDDKSSDGEGDGSEMGLEDAMTKLSRALKDGDAKAAADAFKSAHEICAGYED